jgi:hypothetical protein
MRRALLLSSLVLAACAAGDGRLPSPQSTLPTSATPPTEAPPDVTVLSRGRGESLEWSPCAAVRQFLFCQRSGHWYGREEEVVVRMDVESGAARVFDQNELRWEDAMWSPRLVSDGAAAYWLTKTQIEQLPLGDESPKVVHRFKVTSESRQPDGVAITNGELWQQFIEEERDGGLAMTLIVGSRLGADTVLGAVVADGASPSRRNFFVAPGVRVWAPVSEPHVAIWRGEPEAPSVSADEAVERFRIDPSSVVEYLHHPSKVLAAADGDEVFIISGEQSGYAIHATKGDASTVRTLYRTKDALAELPTHETAENMLVDDAYLYFLDPSWTEEPPGVHLLRLERASKAGSAKPESLGLVQEAGMLWMHAGTVHMVGAVTGDVVRFNRSRRDR